jgi:hypothetical protein
MPPNKGVEDTIFARKILPALTNVLLHTLVLQTLMRQQERVHSLRLLVLLLLLLYQKRVHLLVLPILLRRLHTLLEPLRRA